jgi:hypothetical protein
LDWREIEDLFLCSDLNNQNGIFRSKPLKEKEGIVRVVVVRRKECKGNESVCGC